MPKPPTFDHLKSSKQPLHIEVKIYLDDESLKRVSEAEDALAAADTQELATRGTEGHPEAVTRLEAARRLRDDLRAALDEQTLRMQFRSVGRKKYDQLVTDHPPTEAQVAEAKAAGEEPPPYDAEPFAAALIAASCASPEMSVEQVSQLYDEWNGVEFLELFTAALAVNTGRRIDALGKG